MSSYLVEAEALLKELETQCVGLDEEGNPKDPEEFSEWLGKSHEADLAFCQMSLVLCEIKTGDGNYEHAVKLLERVLRVIEAQDKPADAQLITNCSLPAKEWDARPRHPRSMLNTQMWLQARTRLIEVFLLQGEYESCEQQCAIATQEMADCNEQQMMRRVGVAHATIMTLRGRPQDALVEYEQLINAARAARAEDEVFTTVLVNCGDLRRFMGQHENALALYHEAYKVMDGRLGALGLDTSTGVFKDGGKGRGMKPVVVVHKKPQPEESEEPAPITRADVLDCVHHPSTHLFVDVAIRKAQMQAELGQLDEAMEMLCVARDILERVTHPMPKTVAQLNLFLGRLHAQMEWGRLEMVSDQWGAKVQSEELPSEPFAFAESCLRESFRIMSEVSNHDHVMLRLRLLELSRLHGLESQSDELRRYLQQGSQIATMQHKLYFDTLSLFDAAEISGENIAPGISAGVIDSLRFFKQSRAYTPAQQEAKNEQGSVEVSAPALLMYHLTMVREWPLAGVQLGRLMEVNSTLLHRSLKLMFPRYMEHCCTTAAALPAMPGDAIEPDDAAKKGKGAVDDTAGAVPAGVVSFVWGEFPLGEAISGRGSERSSSRPSSAASVAVMQSRQNEGEMEPKRLPATLLYNMIYTAPPADGEEPVVTPITGIAECSVPSLEALKRELGSSKFDLESYVPADGQAEMPEELKQAAMECVAKCHSVLHQGSEVQEWTPEQAVQWVPTLAKMFNRELGFTGEVDEQLHIWLVQSLRPDLQVQQIVAE